MIYRATLWPLVWHLQSLLSLLVGRSTVVPQTGDPGVQWSAGTSSAHLRRRHVLLFLTLEVDSFSFKVET